MTGLDKILADIQAEAQAEAESAIRQAENDAADILANAQADTDAACARILAEAQRQVDGIERAGASAAELRRRRAVLEAKQAILSQIMDSALETLHALPDADYFALLVRLAAAGAELRPGELLLSARDLARLPDGFEQAVRDALPQGAALTVSGEARPIDGGFILKYGDVEQNCSFRAIFNARHEEMTDKARAVLFS